MHQLKETLRLVGIDVSIFSGHSVRDTSTSAAVEAGITMTERVGVPKVLLSVNSQCILWKDCTIMLTASGDICNMLCVTTRKVDELHT